MTGDNENGQQTTRAQSRRSVLQTMGAAAVGVGGVTAGVESARAEADFDLEIISVPDEIVAGRDSSQPLKVRVRNEGDESDTQVIKVNIGRARKDVSLGPGSQTVVNFTLSPRVTRTGNERIDVECDDDVERTRVQILEPPEFIVEIGEVDDRIVAGREFTFNVKITNEGEAQGSQELEWTVEEKGSFGGIVAEGDTGVGVGGGQTNTFSQTVMTKDSGNKELLIQAGTKDDAGSKTVTQIAPQDPSFEVTILELEETSEGEELSVPLEVFNSGDFEGTKELTVAVGGEELVTNELTIDQRSQTETQFSVPIPYGNAGQQKLTVSSESGEDTEIIEVAKSPQFEVEILETNSPVPQEFPLELAVEVTNTADVAGQDDITAEIQDVNNTSQSLELESGATTTTTLSLNVGSAELDTYEAIVQSAPPVMATDAMREKRQVEVAEVPYYELNNVSANGPVQAGSDVEVRATVANTGTDNGEAELEAVIPDIGEASNSTEIEAGSQGELTFNISTEQGDAGDYTVQVQDGTINTTQQITIEEAPESSNNSTSGGNNSTSGGNNSSSGGNNSSSGGNGGGSGGDDGSSDGVVTESDGNNAPGFGVGTAITSLGGAAYFLKRRLGDDDE